LRPVAQRWNGAIIFLIDRPVHDHHGIFVTRAAFTFSAARSNIAGGAAGAPVAEKLPSGVTGDPRIITERDEATAIELEDVQPLIFLIRFKPAAKVRRQAVAAIVTGARNADPIIMRRLATGIARRLICCTGMRDHVAAIMDGVRPIGLSDR
jgi:hypothetical protein